LADSRFHRNAGPFELGYLADEIGCEIADSARTKQISGTGALNASDQETVSFLANRRYAADLAQTSAGAVLVLESDLDHVPDNTVALVSTDPYYDFAIISQLFHPKRQPMAGISPSATVDPSAQISDQASIDSGASIGPNVQIGAGAWIGPNAVIDQGVTIGEGTHIGAAAYIGYCDIGRECDIHPGVRIGTRGFGFAMSRKGFLDIPQTGTVQIGDFVEIGANSTVDRGMGPNTVIGDGCKLDNLVQIGHNVVLGRGCVITAQSGVAGSTVLDDFVVMGAQSGIAGHLKIGRGAQIAAKCGVIRDLGPGEKVGGLPAVPLRQWLRQHAVLEKLMKRKDQKADG